MKMLSLIVLCTLILGGCSGAVRLQRFDIEPSEGWRSAGEFRTYQCGQSNLFVLPQRTSRFVMLGPIIPLIPVVNENSGDFVVFVKGAESCPVIMQKGKTLQALANKPSEMACLYDQSDLNIVKPIEIRLGDKADQCIANSIQYKEQTDWSYCFMCSR